MKRKFLAFALFCVLLVPMVAFAGDRTLSVNGNDQNDVWFITGEPSLVMNGFDLTSFGVTLPATIDRVTIGVDRPVPGQLIDVVIYQDTNGGSPADATVVGRTQVDITTSGTFAVNFSPAVTITAPAVWVGFYLPVDFRFLADTSGSSVLTYWAWTPGGRFDVANLSSAGVLGPADGSAPVGINLNGKARINLELVTGAGTTTVSTPGAASTPLPQQTAGDPNASAASLRAYPDCISGALLYDTADEVTSLRDTVNLHCREVIAWQSPAVPQGLVRRGNLYDIQIWRANGVQVTSRLDIAVTHCVRPAAEDLNTALFGLAYGFPRRWVILPTQRFGDLICAEVRHGGNISYFVAG